MNLQILRLSLLAGVVLVLTHAKEDCSTNPCLNQGVCQDTNQGYVCICRAGFSGRNCKSNNDDCKNSNPCKNGVCKLDSFGNPQCFCSPGFAGKFCEIDEDECISQPCLNAGKCVDKTNGFSCNCKTGTYGRLCEITQKEIDLFTKACSEEENTICWREYNVLKTVEWGYGHSICNTVHTCFGGENNTETNTYDRFVDVQLHPAQLQSGDTLNLTLEESMQEFVGKLMPDVLPVMKLDSEESFVSCNSSRGSPIVKDPSEFVIVGSKELTGGFHFFMANIDSTFKCEFGLRLNVSVKENHCKHPDSLPGVYCLQHGRCQTNFSYTDYRCKCYTGFYGQFCEKLDYCYNNPCKHGKCKSIEELKDAVCECDQGYVGYDCSIMLDMCLSLPCQNNATCIAKPNEYQCVCPPGFSGRNCEVNIDECASNPCQNGATCNDGIATYSCSCLLGFEGTNCEINIDDCKDNRCKYGVCVDHVNKYKCKCDPGYVGIHCQHDFDDCLDNPCDNEGKCTDRINGFTCDCGFGYQGDRCEIDLDLCNDTQLCTNAESCIDHGRSVTCNCKVGFTGTNCAVAIDWCVNQPCLNGGTCNNHPSGYTCTCKELFTGPKCEVDLSLRTQVRMNLVVEDCNKIKKEAIQDFYHNLSSVMAKACQCAFSESDIIPGSLAVKCQNSVSAELFLEIEPKALSGSKLLCQLANYIAQEDFISLGHDSFVVKILTDTKYCPPAGGDDKDQVTHHTTEDNKEHVDMGSVAIAIGLCIALTGLGLATFFILYRCRRRVEDRKEKARSDDKTIDDLSVDLLSAVAPTPKSLYRTSAYRGSVGYNNMAFSSPYDMDSSTLKSRKV